MILKLWRSIRLILIKLIENTAVRNFNQLLRKLRVT
jgi:hypothetical protein